MERVADNAKFELTAGSEPCPSMLASPGAGVTGDAGKGSHTDLAVGTPDREPVRQAIFDMHCHLAFYDNPSEVAQELAELGVACFNTTVTPAEFEASPASSVNVRTGVGLHPWWLADGRAGEADAHRAAELAAAERYVAEVGLDFARGADAREAQVEALDAILAACEGSEHVLSLHAVRSADAVLDLLEKHHTCGQSHAILHWFSGTSDELARARRMGCLFSVNPRMLATRKGREYARQVPLARLLLETDLPCEPDGPVARTAQAHAALLRQTLTELCELRGEDVEGAVAATSRHLLKM